MIVSDPEQAVRASLSGEPFVLFNGDCVALLKSMPQDTVDLTVTSPPYFMGKSYDRSYSVDDFKTDHAILAPAICSITKPEGNVCWQVGYHVRENEVYPLDYAVYEAFSRESLKLRNRIMWHFGHGAHAPRRFCGRHETILWFSKEDAYHFNLDAVRVRQKYPGKRHYKGPRKGEFSGNPLGKNPSDVWDIPNVKANHVEKTGHPCQFPISLCQTLIRALAPAGALVLDPFAGSASTGIACLLEGRRFIGAELSQEFCGIAQKRYDDWRAGTLRHRSIDTPIWTPRPGDAVAQKPEHFL